MRFAERFLIVLALIALGMRLLRLKDGATMELLALPLLALFYLVSTPVLLLCRKGSVATRSLVWSAFSVLAGVGMAYCIISLMLYTLSWLPGRDMLENSGLILGLLLIIFTLHYRRTKQRASCHYLLRLLLLLGFIVIAFLLPFRGIAAISL